MKINRRISSNIELFEQKINYEFKNKEYILEALTHSSYSNENKNYPFNERLEFLGDSVLSIVISDYLFKKETKLPEGELTKIRANIVCEESLSEVSKNIHLGKYMLLGKGEEATGGRERISILADALEAVIAAIYLDGGIKCAREFILTNMEKIINEVGDLLFACVNVARLLNVDEEEALNKSTKKFVKRFNFIEESIVNQGKSLSESTIDEMNALWEDSKKYD